MRGRGLPLQKKGMNKRLFGHPQLKMMSADGKQCNTDAADLEQLDKPASQKY